MSHKDFDKKQSKYELRKISQGVFDKSTFEFLYALAGKGCITELKGIVSTGKESNIYHGLRGEEEVAVKIYCIDASDFRNMDTYVKGDPRFSSWRNKRQLVYIWAQKEFANLSRVEGKINAPRPIGIEGNVLVMSFIGAGGVSAPKLKELPPLDPEAFMQKVLSQMKETYAAGLVHGDLSEYNILNWGEEPYIIDFAAGVLLDHPRAEELLKRDVKNVLSYFKKLKVETKTDAEALDWIKKKDAEGKNKR